MLDHNFDLPMLVKMAKNDSLKVLLIILLAIKVMDIGQILTNFMLGSPKMPIFKYFGGKNPHISIPCISYRGN